MELTNELARELWESVKQQERMTVVLSFDLLKKVEHVAVTFRRIWKVWNHSYDQDPTLIRTKEIREKYAEDLAEIEGIFDHVYVILTLSTKLNETQEAGLGRFRQSIQALRQCVHKNERLNWEHAEDAPYLAYKSGYSMLCGLIIRLPYEKAQQQFLKLTGKTYEDNWMVSCAPKPSLWQHLRKGYCEWRSL